MDDDSMRGACTFVKQELYNRLMRPLAGSAIHARKLLPPAIEPATI